MAKKSKQYKRPRGAEKKAETIRKRQDDLKKKLIELLEESANLGVALARVGINRSTLSRWKEDDPNFSIEAKHALERGIEYVADNVEISLLASARDGKFAAQKYYLDNNHPRYMKDRWEPKVENPLTEEKKKQIAECMMAWDAPETGDERDEDYEIPSDDPDRQ